MQIPVTVYIVNSTKDPVIYLDILKEYELL